MIKIKITGMKKIQDKLKAIERRAKELHGQQFEIPATEESAAEAQKQLAQHVGLTRLGGHPRFEGEHHDGEAEAPEVHA